MLGRDAGAHRNRDPVQLAQGPQRQSIGRDGRDADRASTGTHRLDGPGCFGVVGRRYPKDGRRARTPLPGRGSDQRGTGCYNHPRRVKAARWRILVGPDAERLDQLVRQSPEQAYDIDFSEGFAREVEWRVGASTPDRSAGSTWSDHDRGGKVHRGSGAGPAIAYFPADRIFGLLDSREYGRPPLE